MPIIKKRKTIDYKEYSLILALYINEENNVIMVRDTDKGHNKNIITYYYPYYKTLTNEDIFIDFIRTFYYNENFLDLILDYQRRKLCAKNLN